MNNGTWEEDVRRTILVVLIYLVPIYLAFKPVTDPDIWFHLAAGQWIWTHGAFPIVDPFSWGETKPWQAYSWGFEILVYAIHRIGGLGGLVIFKTFLFTAIIWRLFSLLRYLDANFSRVAVLILLAIFILVVYLHIRPWFFTILFTILLFEILFRTRNSHNPRYLFWLPLLFICWANIHIQFIYGIGIICVFFAAALCERMFTDWSRPSDIPFRYYGLALLAVIFASLLTPYHLHLYETVWLYTGQSKIFPLIEELRPLEFVNAWSFTVFAISFAGFFKLGKARFKTLLPYVLLPLATFMALRMLRDSWFLMLIVLFLFTECFENKLDQTGSELKYRLPPRFRWVSASIIVLGALIIGGAKQLDTESQQTKLAELYPVKAVEFMKEEWPPGPIFNHFDWGGYLIWNLPEYQVSFDGRTNVYGTEAILNHVKTWRALPVWKDNDALAKARLVLAPRRKPLVSLLRVHSGYDVIYEDEITVIFAAQPHKE